MQIFRRWRRQMTKKHRYLWKTAENLPDLREFIIFE
jgi:hypothetical protein